MRLRLAPLSAFALLASLAAGCGGTSARPHPIVVGAVEDASKFGDPAAKLALARDAGYRAIALSSVWSPPLETPSPTELAALRAASDAAHAAGIRPIVAVYSFSAATPTTAAARAQFAAYAASIVRSLPAVHDVIVGNEPNLNLFWLPQFGPDGTDVAARGYLLLLAETYDALNAATPSVNVIGGALSARGSDRPRARGRPTRRPASSRTSAGRIAPRAGPAGDGQLLASPLPRGLEHPPDFAHPKSTAIGLADYDKLVDLLGTAFDGTAQPGSSLPIVYGEYGLQTVIPPAKAGVYSGAEQPTTKPIDEAAQARAYADAIAIAACDPTVSMLLFFHVSDEQQLERLQTGVFYADDTPKSSLRAVARAARQARLGRSSCP